MDSRIVEIAFQVALHSDAFFILSLGRRTSIGVVSRTVYFAADQAWISYITTAVILPEEALPLHTINLDPEVIDVESGEDSDGEGSDGGDMESTLAIFLDAEDMEDTAENALIWAEPFADNHFEIETHCRTCGRWRWCILCRDVRYLHRFSLICERCIEFP